MQQQTSGIAKALGVFVLLSLGLAHGPAYALDVNTSPGERVVFLSLDSKSMTLDGGSPVFPTAEITKGKKGHVLTVTATVFAFSFDDKRLSMLPAVNNLFLQPPFSQGFTGCPIAEGSTCSATATWVADLDALEQVVPGRVIGKPLTVQFFVTDDANRSAPRSVSGTLIVRLERKR